MSTATIHKRQLFHWIGRDLQKADLSDEERARRYVAYLKGSLTGGLWLRTMDEVHRLDGREYPLRRRMLCFTENRLSECGYHSKRYGRLGLGFPKRFVLAAGGKPVSYVGMKRGDVHSKLLFSAQAEAAEAGLDSADDLDFVIHFPKPLGTKRASSGEKRERKTAGRGGKPATVERRQYGPKMAYQAEGEWRVVEHPALVRRTGVRFQVEEEQSYLHYRPGPDLMTIVFPDRRTQQYAMEDRDIRELLEAARPTVNLFHLEEIHEL